jgi:hypothetical protein
MTIFLVVYMYFIVFCLSMSIFALDQRTAGKKYPFVLLWALGWPITWPLICIVALVLASMKE